MCEEHRRSQGTGHLLDYFDVSTRAEFSELVPEHRGVEGELSSSDHLCGHNAAHPSGFQLSLTLTSPCQFARVAFPALKVERIRGIFLIPAS